MVEALKPRPWGHPINPDDSFGSWLRRQREVREIGLREIAEASKISIRYLEAFEQDRFDVLPAPVFAKGFLREYAKFVGLDSDEVINYYLAASGREESEEDLEREVAPAKSAGKSYALYLVLGVAAVFLMVGSLSWFLRHRDTSEERPPMAAPVVALPEETPETVSEAVAEPTPLPLIVTLDFTQSCWVEAFVDGERAKSELRVQGESLRLEAQSEVRITLGNVAGASIEINGIPYAAAMRDGEAIVIDAELAQCLGETAD